MKDFIQKIIKKYIGDSGYKKNVLFIMIGRTLAQALPILLTPIVSRLYSPEEFGIFGVYLTIISIVSTISNGRYCLAIILPKKEEGAKKIFFASTLLTIVVSSLFLIFLLLFGQRFFSILDAEVLTKYALILFLNILVVGLYESLYYWAIRLKKYKIITVNLILQAVVLVAVRIGAGYLGFTSFGLMLSYTLGYSVAYIFLLINSGINLKGIFNLEGTSYYLKKYIDFPKFSLLADTLRYLTMSAPTLFLNKFFSSASAGYFAMTDKVLASPIWLITSAVTDVFKQEAAEQYREKGSCFKVFFKTTRGLFLIGIIPFLAIFFLSPPLVPIIFGENWIPVTLYIQIFTVMYFARFVVAPVTSVLYIVNKQRINLLFQGLKLIAIIVSFTMAYYLNNLELGLIVWSISTTVIYVLLYIVCFKIAKNANYYILKKKNNED